MVEIDKIATYVPGMDDILRGGIPRSSITIVGGGPGTGKTIFAMQMLFGNAARGAKCVFFTTLSEPLPKVLRYVQTMGFFDQELMGTNFKFVDLGDAIQAGNAQEVLDLITATVEAERPHIIAIDSFKVIHDALKKEGDPRYLAFSLAAYLNVWEVTALLVGEYLREDLGRLPEVAIVDNLFLLTYEREESQAARGMEVMKLRGSGFSGGRHPCEITSEGMRVYQRVGTVALDERFESKSRIASGVPGLDKLLHGGLPELSATLIQGGSGIGKTLLGLHFIAEAASRGDKAIIFSFDERPAQLEARASKLGFDLSGVTVDYTVPIELSTSKWLERARDTVKETGAKRVLIDSLTTMSISMNSQHFREVVYTAVKMFRSMGITLIMTVEAPSLLSTSDVPGANVSESADNLIGMRYVEVESHLKRAIVVVKMRDSSHETDLREFTIGDKGIEVGEAFAQFRGVLSGQPTPGE